MIRGKNIAQSTTKNAKTDKGNQKSSITVAMQNNSLYVPED